LTNVKRGIGECFKGRSASATVVLGQREYQVSVMVGDRASKKRIAEALDVARSFNLKR
jgi:DNA-binding CsgD family transcriptional regulator